MAFTIPTIFTAVDKFSSTVIGMSAKTQSAFGKIKHGADNAFEKIVNIRHAIEGFVAVEAGKKIFEFAKSFSELGHQTSLTAKRLGLTAEGFQELKFAANIAGIQAEDFTSGMETMNVSVGKLHAGTGRLYSMLKKTNPVLAQQLRHAKTNEQAFDLITTAVNKLKTPMDKAALAQLAFGGAGSKMINFMAKGKDGIKELREEARKYGGVISGDAAEQSEKFIEAQKRMDFAIEGVTNTLGIALMPVIQNIIEKFTVWIGANRDLIKTKIEVFVKNVSSAIMFLANHVDSILLGIKLFIGAIIALKVASISSAIAMGVLRAATIAFNVIQGITVALMGGSALAFESASIGYYAYRAAVMASVAAQWLFNAALGVMELLFSPIGIAIAAVVAIVHSLYKNWDMVVSAFKNGGILSGIIAIGKTLLDAVLMPLQAILSLIAKFTGADWASSAVKGIEGFRKNLGLNVETDESGNALPGKDIVSPKATAHQAMVEKHEQTNNAKVGLTIDNRTNNRISTTNPNGININVGSTFAMGGTRGGSW